MFSQAFKAIPNLSRFKGHAGFADYLDDLGNLQGFKDLVIGHSSAVSTFIAKLATNVAYKATIRQFVSDTKLSEVIKQAMALLMECSYLYRSIFNPEPWIDPDDAPEITAADLRRGIWSVNGKIVSEAEGRVVLSKKLKELGYSKNDS